MPDDTGGRTDVLPEVIFLGKARGIRCCRENPGAEVPTRLCVEADRPA